MQDIKSIVNHLFEQAKKTLLKKGELEPKLFFLILYPGQKTAVYYPVPVSGFFENEGQYKSFIPGYVQIEWMKKKDESPAGIELKAVCLISDSWWAPDDKEAITTQPKYHSKRREAIVMTVVGKNDKHIYIANYRRNSSKIVFDSPIPDTTERFRGWMYEIFPKRL